jgi:hypothetical protein
MFKKTPMTTAVLVALTGTAHAWSHHLEWSGPYETKCVFMWPDSGRPLDRVTTNIGASTRVEVLAYAWGVAATYNRESGGKFINLRDRAKEFVTRLEHECRTLERAEYTGDAKVDRDQRFVSDAAVYAVDYMAEHDAPDRR